ncbi:MAG TPA: response regulator transcription factor [Allosphingosinicella sp.]
MALILVVDDHPLFRDGFAYMARVLRPGWSLRFAESASSALELLREMTPDLVIVDIGLPGDDGFTLLKTIAHAYPNLPQALISGRDDPAVRVRARSCGARGFISKTTVPELMAEQVDALLAGNRAFTAEDSNATLPELTTRQAEVLLLLTEGHGNKEIRHRLGIAERTVRAHLTDLFQLLGAHSRTQAIIRARELGLIGG